MAQLPKLWQTFQSIHIPGKIKDDNILQQVVFLFQKYILWFFRRVLVPSFLKSNTHNEHFRGWNLPTFPFQHMAWQWLVWTCPLDLEPKRLRSKAFFGGWNNLSTIRFISTIDIAWPSLVLNCPLDLVTKNLYIYNNIKFKHTILNLHRCWCVLIRESHLGFLAIRDNGNFTWHHPLTPSHPGRTGLHNKWLPKGLALAPGEEQVECWSNSIFLSEGTSIKSIYALSKW